MKNLIKSVLIVLCIFLFFGSIFQGTPNMSNPNISEDLEIFEENIQNGNIINNDQLLEEEITIIEGNSFGKLGTIICNFFVSAVTGFIKLIVEIISKII